VIGATNRKDGRSLTALWQQALREASTFTIHQALSTDPTRNVTFTVSSALRTAMKLAVSFRATTGHPPGTRVAILSEGFGELFPLYHAMWLLGMTVVAIPSSLPPRVIAEHLNSSDSKVLVYSPAQMARLAKVIPHVTRLSHRIACGELRGKESVVGAGGLSLQELAQNSEKIGKLEDFQRNVDQLAPPALIVFTEGRHEDSIGIEFSIQALLAAAEYQSSAYFRGASFEHSVSLLPSKHIVSLVHVLLVPLVAKLLAFDFTNYDQTVKTWNLYDELVDNQVTAVILDEHRIKELPQITKTNRVSLPEVFRFLLLPTKPIFPEYVGTISDLIAPCYGMSEAGGLVSVGAKGSLIPSAFKSTSGSSIIAAGIPLGGVTVRLDDRASRTIRGDPIGQIIVQSEQVMTRYSAPVQGRAQRGAEGCLVTGDYGAWHFDDGGRSHLVVVGRDNVLFERQGKTVSLFELELALLKVAGVKDVVLVEFPHKLHGQELAAFVVVLTQYKGRVSRETLWQALLRFFPWEVVPKIFMIADERQITSLPVRSILVEKLEAFSAVDFSKRPPV